LMIREHHAFEKSFLMAVLKTQKLGQIFRII